MPMSIAVGTALVVGFLTGLTAFKIKVRWCPRCGTTTTRHAPGLNQGRYRA